MEITLGILIDDLMLWAAINKMALSSLLCGQDDLCPYAKTNCDSMCLCISVKEKPGPVYPQPCVCT